MRFTVTRKIALGFALVLLLGISAMMIIYQGLGAVMTAMDRLARINEPAHSAAAEMEIQVHALVADILTYVHSGDSHARDRMRRHESKFEASRDKYVRLTDMAGGELGGSIGREYEALMTVGKALIARKDEHEALNAAIADNFERMDKIIDERLQPQIGWSLRLLQVVMMREKLELVLDVEADIAEIGLWLANYQRVQKMEYRDRIVRRAKEVSARLRRLQTLELTPEERSATVTLEKLFDRTVAQIDRLLTGDADMREGVKEVVALATEMDRNLDERIQTVAQQELLVPTKVAEAAARDVFGRIRLLIPLFVLAAIVVGFMLVRVIIKPVRSLVRATEAVARGDLTHRVEPAGRDELADLAREFNRMVAELEATTVSKRQLEASELQLRHTVARLHEEIADRIHAQQEQSRLQSSLSRAQTMAAMGAVVAGVAHEVRNPLFGISSALDAMDARFGARGEYQRYMSTLRDQVTRLTDLMRELLEYGKAPSPELGPGSVAEVIEEALRACGPLAERSGARIVKDLEAGRACARIEPTRLARAFENILRNAIQHTPPDGIITVFTREVTEEDGAWSVCTITDSGPGIGAADLPRIFEPFFTRRPGGTGLGLSIVQRIVEEHGGRITASNGPVRGAVMTMSLPLLRS
jgi:C4-dicarboxylate-specific signal transduction histidine kinase